MALALALLLAWGGTARAAGPIVCSDWTQVNTGAFGMGTGGDSSYASEEGFEVLTFSGRLYVGMEADNTYGARLWRTRAGVTAPAGQADWEEVIADGAGKPFGVANVMQNDHVDSLAAFNGYLYVGTANGGTSTFGTQVWRSPSGDPGSWKRVNRDGFGDLQNTNFKDMQVFNGWLCGGTQNWITGAQVWCTADGVSWAQKNHGGFGGGADNPATVEVWSGHVFGGALYFGTQRSSNVAALYRTTDLAGTPVWTQVYTGTANSYRADILGDLNGYLYIGVSSGNGIVILRSATGDAGTWTQVNVAGMDANPTNAGSVVDGGVVHNGALYVGVTNLTGGAEVWRTAGVLLGSGWVDWTQVGGSGLGDANNLYTELIPFNGDLYAWTSNYVSGQQVRRTICPTARNVILMVGDGMGANHQEAARRYYGTPLVFDSWADQGWISTFNSNGSYNTTQAWSNFDYVKSGYTDSAEAASALYSGVKTADSRISVSADGASRLFTVGDKARALGRAVGAVSTVQISHATPAAWIAHNASRGNSYAIADEGLWGDPNTTGSGGFYSGGYGPTLPPVDVLIGGGHPGWNSGYVNATQRDKLAAESGSAGAFTFVERLAGQADGGSRLLNAANTSAVTRLAGLFGGAGGNIEYRLANGSGHQAENPTLAEMTQAALAVLKRDPDGFVLMVEGGAVDWGAHANNMNQMLGEAAGFNAAVQVVVDWVNANDPTWSNTLVVVTSDHETGYLTAGPGIFPTAMLGTINDATLDKEKPVYQGEINTGRRASWDDTDNDNEIDAGETVHWAWNFTSHTNSLVPVYAKGAGACFLGAYATGSDTARGPYLDNTDVFRLLDAVTTGQTAGAAPPLLLTFLPMIRYDASGVTLTWPAIVNAIGYEVWQAAVPDLNPGDLAASHSDVPASANPLYTDGAASAAPGATFYTARGVAPGSKSATSGRVGVFSFALQPGQ